MLADICDLNERSTEQECRTFFNKVGNSYRNAVTNDYATLCNRVTEGRELVFVAAGWKKHAMYLGFFGKYLCIINRGQTLGNESTVSFYRFDPSKMTLNIMIELLDVTKEKTKSTFVEKDLLQILDCKKDETTIAIFKFIQDKKLFQAQTRENCTLANAKPLLFFAKLFEESTFPNELNAEESYEFYKEFTKFARGYVLEKTSSKD